MRGTGLAMAIWLACIPTVAQTPKPASPLKPTDLVPDPGWEPAVGDRVVVYTGETGGAYAATNMFTFQALVKSLRAKDTVGVEELIEKKQVGIVPPNTKIIVRGITSNPYIADGVEALEVRFQDGPYRDQAAWILRSQAAKLVTFAQVQADKAARDAEMKRLRESVERQLREDEEAGLIPKVQTKPSQAETPRRPVPVVMPKPKPRTFKGGTPAARASEAYRAARKLETSGKLREAIAAYEDLSGGIFPEGRMAKARLKVLTGK